VCEGWLAMAHAAREAKVDSGKAQFLDIAQLKQRLRR
jgi:hypothetical protein